MKKKWVILGILAAGILFILNEYRRADLYNQSIEAEHVSKKTISEIVPSVRKMEQDPKMITIEPEIPDIEIPEAVITKKTASKKNEEFFDTSKRENPNLEINHENLSKRNTDYRAWLSIPNTKINYPVVKGQDNKTYLHLDLDGNYLYAGTLFMDAYSKKGIEQEHIIIYGHNMKSGSMFGTLKKWKDKSYFEKHPYIHLYTPQGDKEFVIFSIRESTANVSSLDYSLEGFKTKDFVENAKKSSIQSRNVRTGGDRQIITLVSCTSNSNKRLLLSAIEI